MSKFNLLAAIEQYAEKCNLTKGLYDPRRIINKSPYPWGKTQCPPMILLFQYFNQSQINTFLENNIKNIDGTAFSKHFTTSSWLSPTQINALSVAKDKGYYKAYLMGVGCLDAENQNKHLKDIQDIFKKFLSNHFNYSILKYIHHVPENMKFDILKLQRYETSGPTIFDLIKRSVALKNLKSLLANLTIKQKSQLLNIKNNELSELFVNVLTAIWINDEQTLTSLLKKLKTQQKIELLKIQNNDGWSPLHEAIDYYNTGTIDNTGTIELLLKGLSANQKFDLLKLKNKYGSSPLYRAVNDEKIDIIKLLLDGISPDQKFELLSITTNDDWTLLYQAVTNSDNKTVKILLDGISKDQKFVLLKLKTKDGSSPLYEAVQHRNIDAIKLFLEDLSPDQKFELLKIQDKDGWTTINIVSDYRKEKIEPLLDGISANQKFDLLKLKTMYGPSPLYQAVQHKNIDAIKLFLEDLSPDQKFELLKIQDNFFGETQTPLRKAISYKFSYLIKLLLKDLTAQHRVSLQLSDPESDYQVPEPYKRFVDLNIDITIPYKKLNEQQQSMIDDRLQSMIDHNPELVTSHIIPSYQKMKRDNLLHIHNNSKEQLLGMIENLPEDEKTKHSDLINELKTSLAKQDLTQEESMTLMMQDMSKDKHSSHYKTVEALRFIDNLTKQSSTAVSDKQLSKLIDHAITELTQDLPEKAALKSIWKFSDQFSSGHLQQLEKLLFNVELYRNNPSSEKPDPSSKSKPSFTSKVSEGFSVQSAQSMIKDIVQSLKEPSSNTTNQPKN
ncbi:MAG: ankyrin repeat domain-containing protein [Candidatus Comchoanobacterales bacterium]